MTVYSQVDSTNVKTWTFSIVCAILTFINVSVHLGVSSFPGLGYPCAYYHLIDFNELNMTAFNVMHRLTPQLYLDAAQIVAFVTFTEVTFLLILAYYVTCWAKIYFRRGPGTNVNQSSRDISYMGDSASCFLFVLSMDTFQLFTLTMSFRLPSMIAFTCCLYFITLTVFVVIMLTQYQSYERSSFALSKIHPKLQGAVKFKTLIINLAETLLGVTTMTVALSLSLGIGNNFFLKTGHVVYSALATFAVIAIIYFLAIESVLHRYMKIQVGYALGTLFGICGAVYPVLKYESISASEYAAGIHIFLGSLFAGWVIFVVCRLIRFLSRGSQKYKPLTVSAQEVRGLREDDTA